MFLQTVHDGIEKRDWFSYAAREKAPSVYEGLVFGTGGHVYMDESSILVHPDAAAKAQLAVEPETDREHGGSTAAQQPISLPLGQKRTGAQQAVA